MSSIVNWIKLKYTVNMAWKYRFSHLGPTMHSNVANFMLISDLKSVFELLWQFERIWWSKWWPPKALFSGLFSEFEALISLLVNFSYYGALYQNWPFVKDLSTGKSILTNTGGQKRYLQFFFSSLAKFRKFLATSLNPELLRKSKQATKARVFRIFSRKEIIQWETYVKASKA